MPTVADYIERHRERLIEQYLAAVSQLEVAEGLSLAVLVDTMPEYLDALAMLSRTSAPGSDVNRRRYEEAHANIRLRLGFQQPDVTNEYALIGTLISALWAEQPVAEQPAVEDIQRLFDVLQASMDNVVAIFSGYTIDDRQTEKRFLRQMEALARGLLDGASRGGPPRRQLHPLVEVIQKAVHADGAALFLIDQDTRQTLQLAALTGLCARMTETAFPLREQSFLTRFARSDETVYIPDITRDPGAPASLREHCGLRSLLGLRMHPFGRLLGVVYVGVGRIHPFSPRDRRRLEILAEHLANIVERIDFIDALRRAAHARETMLRMVSHDLRTPLTSIVMQADVLERTALQSDEGAPVLRHAGAIRRAAEHMDRLIADLEDIRGIEIGRITIERCACHPQRLLAEAYDVFKTAAEDQQVTLTQQAPDALPLVSCDPARMQQVLSNLLNNALNVTAAGGRVALEAREADNAVVFSVEDTGPGIADDELPHLFDPYWRGQRTQYKGSGLGLAIAKGIVEAHGGRIWVESRVGAGSTFYVAIPRRC